MARAEVWAQEVCWVLLELVRPARIRAMGMQRPSTVWNIIKLRRELCPVALAQLQIAALMGGGEAEGTGAGRFGWCLGERGRFGWAANRAG